MLSFSSVYESLKPELIWAAGYYISDTEDAKEVVNDVFIKMSKLNISFASAKDMKNYAHKVLKNECLNKLKVIKRRKNNQQEASWYLNNTQDIFDTEVYEMIRRAVDALDAQYRIIVFEYYYERRTCEEIARKLNLTIDSVRYRLKTGRRLIKAAVI